MRFRNRTDAGQQLAARLAEYGGRSDVIVLALPRGGVPVASEVRHAGIESMLICSTVAGTSLQAGSLCRISVSWAHFGTLLFDQCPFKSWRPVCVFAQKPVSNSSGTGRC